MGWGLVGARLCVPASDSSPQERHRHKTKLTAIVMKTEMTPGDHKTSQLEFSSKQTRVTDTTAAVKIVEQHLFDSKRPYRVLFTLLGTLRLP